MGPLVISSDYFTTKRSRTFRKLAIAVAVGAIAYATLPPVRLIINSGVSYIRHQACKWNHRNDAWWEVWEWPSNSNGTILPVVLESNRLT